jgi:hypothetical protein
VLPHFEVGDYFKRHGDILASSKRDLAKAESIPTLDVLTAIRQRLWTARIEATDQNVTLATLAMERCRRDPANSLS